MLYTEAELVSLERQLRRDRLILLILAGILAAGMLTAFLLRAQLWAVVLTILAGTVLLAGNDLVLRPLRAEIVLTRCALGERVHPLTATVTRLGEPALIDDVRAHGVLLSETADAEDERLLYLDDSRESVTLRPGDRVSLLYHGRMIVSLSKA